mmetsp:Transcript_43318/g.107588  ORF Transcript_43318/g.107588 Transcript_43318/m.107588 type:complete len:219 (+) Transcript_43318:657-1313(+)
MRLQRRCKLHQLHPRQLRVDELRERQRREPRDAQQRVHRRDPVGGGGHGDEQLLDLRNHPHRHGVADRGVLRVHPRHPRHTSQTRSAPQLLRVHAGHRSCVRPVRQGRGTWHGRGGGLAAGGQRARPECDQYGLGLGPVERAAGQGLGHHAHHGLGGGGARLLLGLKLGGVLRELALRGECPGVGRMLLLQLVEGVWLAQRQPSGALRALHLEHAATW